MRILIAEDERDLNQIITERLIRALTERRRLTILQQHLMMQ